MTKDKDFQIDLEIHKLELEGIDKVLDVIKLILAIGTPVCAGLLSQGLNDWWQLAAFSALLGIVSGAFVELFAWTRDRGKIVSKMKQRYLNYKSEPVKLPKRSKIGLLNRVN